MSQEQLEDLAQGQRGSTSATVEKGALVSTGDQQYGVKDIAAVRLREAAGTMTATLAVGYHQCSNSVFDVDSNARTFFVFGAAAQPRSPVGDYLADLDSSAEAYAARGCVS